METKQNEIKNEAKPVCVHCGSNNLDLREEVEWNDGAGEPNTSNYLETSYYLYCNECGDNTYPED